MGAAEAIGLAAFSLMMVAFFGLLAFAIWMTHR